MQIISFMYLSLIYLWERKKFTYGGTEGGISLSRTHPLRHKERVHSFFLPPPPKKFSYGPGYTVPNWFP